MFVDYLNESKGHVKNLKRSKRLNEYYDDYDDPFEEELDMASSTIANALNDCYKLLNSEFSKFDPEFLKWFMSDYKLKSNKDFISTFGSEIWSEYGFTDFISISSEYFENSEIREMEDRMSYYFDKYY